MKNIYFLFLTQLFVFFSPQSAQGQTQTFLTGSFIINMGVTPQTIGNGLKPYGMVYDLVKDYGVPIKWVINSSKIKDGIDFTHNGINYRGGTFIIPAEYRIPAVNTRIAYWQGLGVVGATSVSPITLSTGYITDIFFAPNWTLDQQNGSLAVSYFVNAGIPPSAYGGSSSSNWQLPANLDCCDDIFIMPHADPKWLTHSNLYYWNQNCNGAIWLGCHAGSALEDMFKNTAPVDYNLQTNFLSEKTGPASGGGPYYQNALLLWGNHSGGTLPYSYDYPTDYVMQFMGILDAATQNGSEQIYIPLSPGWRTTTHVGVYDPDHTQKVSTAIQHRAAIVAYGPGMGDPSRGKVMLEASHSLSKATAPANVAAQRAFFNFSFWAAKDKEFLVTFSNLPSVMSPGTTYPGITATVSSDIPSGPYTYLWSSTCGGTFSNPTSATTSFTSPVVSGNTPCIIQCKVTDACGRSAIFGSPVTIECNLQVTATLINPCYETPSGGSISMTISNGGAPYNWTWTRTSPSGGPVSGSGTTISGLSAGIYNVTVTDHNGAGCSASFSVTLTQSTQIIISATPIPVLCNGGSTGAINVSVTGGNLPYSYQWGDGPGTQNRSGLSAGSYTLTVTDSKGCFATTAVSITQPAALNISPTVTNVTCYDFNNGSISLSVTGGVPGYNYLWSNGATTNPLSNLSPGIYSVTVTDANACTQTYTNISITQPPAPLELSSTQSNILCFGYTTGSIDLSVSGGTAGYTYAWAGPSSFSAATQDINALAAGIYTVTVTDNNGCTAVHTATITQPTALTLSGVVVNPTCPPNANPPVNSDGAIDITVTGGTAPYSIDWADIPGTTNPEDRTSLAAGVYSVTVTDANNCIVTATFTLNNINPNPIQPSSINN